MRIILLGNYEPDHFLSMERFADVLFQRLPRPGLEVELLRPRERFGRILNSSSGLGKWLGYIDKYVLFPFDLKKKISTVPATVPVVVHICDHSNAAYTRYLQKTPHLVTCHDLLAVRSARGEFRENPTRWTGRLLQRSILRGLNRAARVVCDSEATRRDVLRLSSLSSRQVDLNYIGLNYDYRPMEKTEARQQLQVLEKKHSFDVGKSGTFLMHVGGNQWYKNRLGVLRIYQDLAHDFGQVPPLIMAGSGFTPDMNRFVAENKLGGKIFSTPNCSNEELRALYSLAELLLFPSLEEGFGWPILEGQACGCRVITINKPPMTEVGGDAAIYFEPQQIHAAAATVRRLLNQSPAEKQGLIQKGFDNAARFSISRMVENYISHYHDLIGQHAV